MTRSTMHRSRPTCASFVRRIVITSSESLAYGIIPEAASWIKLRIWEQNIVEVVSFLSFEAHACLLTQIVYTGQSVLVFALLKSHSSLQKLKL